MTRNGAFLSLLTFASVALAGVLLRPAVPIDETRYLSVAWEMRATGDWLVPTKNFEIYTHKPPVLFWAMNLVWLVTGVSEFAARLVGPAFALAAIFLTGRLARILWPDDGDIGTRAILALSGLLLFDFYGGLTMFDAALAATTVAGVYFIVRAVDSGNRRYWLGLGAALAAGGLIKGPVILVHLLPLVILAPVWSRGRSPMAWREMTIGAGISVASGLAIVALWLVPAIISGGQEYRDAVLWTQSAGRMTESFAHAKPWWFFLALLPSMLFPWILVPAIWRSVARQDWSDAALRLCAIWSVTAFFLFSLISGKQMHYLLPELPAVALIVARVAPGKFALVLPALVMAGLALAGIFFAAGAYGLGKVEELLESRPMVLAWALLLIGFCLVAVRSKSLAGGVVLSLGFILAFNLLFGLTATRSHYDSHNVAELIAPFETDGIAFYGWNYQSEFNFSGRLTSPVANPNDEKELDAWVAEHPAGVIIARLDRDHPDWPKHRTVEFRNAPYAIWRSVDAVKSEPSS